jgi:hypothetical protein
MFFGGGGTSMGNESARETNSKEDQAVVELLT